MDDENDYSVLFGAWSMYCAYFKEYIARKGRPPSVHKKINNQISIAAKTEAMKKHDISEDIEGYDEYNEFIERRGALVNYMDDVYKKVSVGLSDEKEISNAADEYIFTKDIDRFSRLMDSCDCKRDDF
jgi:hypothetical protein